MDKDNSTGSGKRKKQFKQAFAVVAFAGENSDDESVEAVPISWLTPQKRHCYWPPVTQPSKLKKAISSAVEPMPDWEKHDARCLKKCQDYISARQKCVLAQLTSDLDTDVTDVERSKSRARRQRSQFNLVDDVEPDDPVGTSAPSPPASFMPKTSSATKALPSVTLKPPPPPPATLTPKTSSVAKALPSVTPKRPPPPSTSAANLSLTPLLPAASLTPPPPPASPTPPPPPASLIPEDVPLQQDRKIVTLLMELKSQMQVLAHQQQQMMAMLSKTGGTGGSKPVPKLPEGVVLPLNTFDQLTRLERKLSRSQEDQQMLTAYLGLIGGLSIRSTTAAVMKAVMTTELARLFNFCGLRGKQGFSALQLKEVVCDAVRMNRLTKSASNTEIESVMKDWLRTASDRSGGRRKRDEDAKNAPAGGSVAESQQQQSA